MGKGYTHLRRSTNESACGQVTDRYGKLTDNPDEVNCKGCKKTVLYKRKVQ